jgi:YegS/Rv2252/BmrU family lipid kinase
MGTRPDPTTIRFHGASQRYKRLWSLDRTMQVGSRRCVLNPQSGTADHADYVGQHLRARGFAVTETESKAHAIELGREAGRDGVSTLAVCGGDGTVNDVLTGVYEADALGDVTLAVVPTGTANLLAGTVGIRDVDHGIEVADTGAVREVDVGVADDQPFVVSTVAGLPADASTAASDDLKERFGTLAFLVTGARETLAFDPLDIRVVTDDEVVFDGPALSVLVGNARKFVEEGGQAAMEDGRFDVAIVEEMPPTNAVAEAAAHRLLARGTEGVTHLRAGSVTVEGAEPITFSLDGELKRRERLSLSVRPRALGLRVGEGYEPSPG